MSALPQLGDAAAWGGSERAAEWFRAWKRAGYLGSLDVSGCDLTELPVGQLMRIEELQRFVCHINKLTSIPAELCQMTQLVKLSVHYNNIGTLPSALGKLQNLKKFCCSGNPIETLPPELLDLPLLEVLVVSECHLGVSALCALATAVKRSSTLKTIFFWDNPGSKDAAVDQAFVSALRSNSSLRWLHKYDPDDPDVYEPNEADEIIQAALLRNRVHEPAPEPYHPMVKSVRMQ